MSIGGCAFAGIPAEEAHVLHPAEPGSLRGSTCRGSDVAEFPPGSPKDYLKLQATVEITDSVGLLQAACLRKQVAMELIKAFCGDAGPLQVPGCLHGSLRKQCWPDLWGTGY